MRYVDVSMDEVAGNNSIVNLYSKFLIPLMTRSFLNTRFPVKDEGVNETVRDSGVRKKDVDKLRPKFVSHNIYI